MSKKVWLASCVGLSFLLSGCGNDPKEANVENFTKVIQEYLVQKNEFATCLPTPTSDTLSKEDIAKDSFAIIYKNGGRSIIVFGDPQENLERAQYFVKQGLLTEESIDVELNTFSGVIKEPAFVYRLTPEGKKAIVNSTNFSDRFCTGQVVLDKVDYFTEPVDGRGMKESRVVYSVKFENQAPWATSDEVSRLFAHHYEGLKGDMQRTIHLILTNEGWKVR